MIKVYESTFKIVSLMSAFILLGPYTQQVNAQIVCNNQVQVALTNDCEATVMPDDILEGTYSNYSDFSVTIEGHESNVVTEPGTYGVTVTNDITKNACWSVIVVEDKAPPSIYCEDVTVSCGESIDTSVIRYTLVHGGCGTVNDSFNDVATPQECQDSQGSPLPYSTIITRTWNVYDEKGNTSTCIQNIYVSRVTLTESNIEWPSNYDDLDEDAFVCNDPLLSVSENIDSNGHPATSLTGVPGLEDGPFCSEVEYTYKDLKLDICPSSYKVIRTWKVVDWCTGDIFTYDQIIKVAPRPLVCTAPDEFVVDTDPFTCTATVVVPAPTIPFACGGQTSYTVSYKRQQANGDPYQNPLTDGVTGSTEDGYTISGISGTRFWIIYTISDECGNTNQCFTEVDIIDNDPPTPVCEETTVVSLGPDGIGWLDAESLDDGSWDNCAMGGFLAAKETDLCDNDPGVYKSSLQFCCAEIGTTVMVGLQVTDAAGNSNTCWVEVWVQDKFPPVLNCPADITLDCFTNIDDLSVTGEATANDNCYDTSISHRTVGDLNQCGSGTISRWWIAVDTDGRVDSCLQTITVVDGDLFDRDDIVFPADIDLDGCGSATDPNAAGEPVIADDICSMTAATHEDIVFASVEGACLKIIRTWTVIDWCQYSENNGSETGKWTDLQTIRVIDGTDPVFVSWCEKEPFPTTGDGCSETLTFVAEAIDECTPADQLNYWYEIDMNNDGTIDSEGTGTTFTSTFDVGVHKLTQYAEDGCGNIAICNHPIEIVDGKAPTPYCLSIVSTVVMPSTGSLTIWASDFDYGSYDNCTPKEDLVFSFSADSTDTNMTFSCSDISNGQSQILSDITLYVHDKAGNYDFCQVFVNLQDNAGNVCGDADGLIANISGLVRTEENKMVENVQVTALSQQTNFPVANMTSSTGQYAFNDVSQGYNYRLESFRNDDVANGVTTLDLVLIQRHILNITDLNSPYKIIAADTDNSQTITAADLVILRKVILGVNDSYPNGQESWRFVAEGYAFNDATNPFPFEEHVDISQLTQSMPGQNFMAVKIGDVTADAIVNQANSLQTRSNGLLDLLTENKNYKKGEVVDVELRSDSFENILGLQNTFSFNTNTLVFNEIRSNELQLDETNLGLTQVDGGLIALSWSDVSAVSKDEDDILMTLSFTAIADGKLSRDFSLNSRITKAEAYTKDLESLTTELKFIDELGAAMEATELVVYQNSPNPFRSTTNIGFDLPRDSEVIVSIFDLTGKTLYSKTRTFAKGYNSIQLSTQDLNARGVFYYTIQTDSHSVTKQMIGIK